MGPPLPTSSCSPFLLLWLPSPGVSLLLNSQPDCSPECVPSLGEQRGCLCGDCDVACVAAVSSVERRVKRVARAASLAFAGMWKLHVHLVVWSDQRDSRCPRWASPSLLVCLVAVIFWYFRVATVADNFIRVRFWQISDLTLLTLFPNRLKWNLFIVLHTSVRPLPEVSHWKLHSRAHFPFLTVVLREGFPSGCYFTWDCAFSIWGLTLQLSQVIISYSDLPVLSWHNSKIVSFPMHWKSFPSIKDLALLVMLQMVLQDNKNVSS